MNLGQSRLGGCGCSRLPALHARPELQKNKKAWKNWKMIKSRENMEKRGQNLGLERKVRRMKLAYSENMKTSKRRRKVKSRPLTTNSIWEGGLCQFCPLC